MSRAERACRTGEEMLAAGQLPAAATSFRLAVDLGEPLASELPAARVITGHSYLGLGRVALQEGRWTAARSATDRAAALLPGEWGCSYYSGCALGASGDFLGAVEAFDRALTMAPEQPRIRAQRGYARFQLGHLNEALADLSAAVTALDDRGRLILANLLAKRGDWADAEALLTGTRLHRATGWSSTLLGYVREKSGRASEAIDAYRQALDDPATAAFAAQRLRELAVPSDDSLPLLDATLLLLEGQRAPAIEVLERAHARDPFRGVVAHALFLASYFGAVSAAPRLDGGAHRLWERAIAAWVVLLHCDGFWSEFQGSFRERCGIEGAIEPDESVRTRIQEQLSVLFDDGFQRSGEPAALRRLLLRELAAAEHLREMGGLRVSGRPGAALVCGPLGVRVLGLESALEERLDVAAASTSRAHSGTPRRHTDGQPIQEQPPAGPEPSKEVRLARHFSMLGAVQALVDLDRPGEALAALDALSCPHCEHLRAPGCSPDSEALVPQVCVAGCPGFDRENPSYRARAAKEQFLRAEAIDLAVDVHLAVAWSAVRATTVDVESASSACGQAMRLAEMSGTTESALQRITTMVLGRVRALTKDSERDVAITLLESAIAVCQNPDDKPLTGRLAELLTDRGIAAGNQADWPAAVADLRSAVRRNRHASRPLVNLGIALRAWSADSLEHGDEAHAESLLAECFYQLRDARALFAGKADVEEQYRQAATAFREALNGRAVTLAEDRQFDLSLELLEEALRHFPDDDTVATNERNILLSHAMALATSQRFGDAQRVLDRAERRCRNDAALLEEVNRARLFTLKMSTKGR